MKSEDASPALRKLTENFARHMIHGLPPTERIDETFVLLVCPAGDDWAIGLRIDFSSESWSIAEVVALPAGPVRTLPDANSVGVRSYVEAAVDKARARRRIGAEQLMKLRENAEFIQERFEAWRDKASPKSNVEYAALAAKYAEQIREGNTRATATLADLVNMSPSVMAQRIKEARRRALLTPGERGRASGALTPLGVLYADPEFPGVSQLRAAGMTERRIADKFGISESLVWRAIAASHGPDEAEIFPESAQMSTEVFLPEYGRGE
ncbi:hypothetical protein [Pseudarthrobacter sp. MDT1-22]